MRWILWTLIAQVSLAQEAPVGEEMEVVVTAAAPSGTASHEAPALVKQIDQAELKRDLVRTVPEALRYEQGVAVQKTSNGQGSPIIRGFTGNRTLAQIDGIRYNHSAYRDGPNEYFALIDPLALASIELVQGPGSVLSGSDAVGGTLNLHTQQADWRGEHSGTEGQNFAQGSLFGRWHSAEQSYTGRLDYSLGQAHQWGLHLGGSWRDFGNLIDADLGEQLNTGYQTRSYDARLDVALNANWTLTLAHQALWQDDSWRTHATIFGQSFAQSEIGSDLRRVTDYQRSLSYIRLRGEDLQGWASTAQLTLSYQTLDEDSDRIRSNRVQELSNLGIGILGIDAKFTSSLSEGTLTWGADYYEDRVDTARVDIDGIEQLRRVQGPVGDDAEYRNAGVYAQYDRKLFGQRTHVYVGGRFSYLEATVGRFEDPLTGGAASLAEQWSQAIGSFRLVQQLDQAALWNAFGSVAQAFRAPNLGDLTRLGASRSDEIESAAAGLEPERFITYELGLRYSSEKLRFATAVYHTQIQDYITTTPTGRIIDQQRQVTKQNSSSGFVQGATGELEWDLLDQWTFFGGLSWTNGEADVFSGSSIAREPLSRIPPLTGSYGLRWRNADDRLTAEFIGQTAARADRLNSADLEDTQRIPPGGTPSYTLLSLRLSYKATENLTLFAGVENLLDQPYRVHGSGTNEPGRGATLGARFTF
jgi:hemoglobin/transferrin/lactoferrin receptor protein